MVMIGMSNDDDFHNETGMQKLNIMNCQAFSVHLDYREYIFIFLCVYLYFTCEYSLCPLRKRILPKEATVQASRTKSKASIIISN